MATFNSPTTLELGNADVSVGNGQLGVAVFVNLAANLTANSLPIVYDTYVLDAAALFTFDLPTAIQGYKVHLIASGASNVTIRSDAGVAFYTLRAGRSAVLQLIATGPQVWHRYAADNTLNDAYKNGTTGIINWDATRQAVKVSSHPSPVLSDVLLSATYPGDAGLEGRALEVGSTHIELLCEQPEGILDKTGRSVAIHSTAPSASSSLLMTATSTASVDNSLLFGPFTATLTEPVANIVYIAPNGRANFGSITGANASSVIIAPSSTLALDPGTNPRLDQMLLGCTNTITIDDMVAGSIIGSRNVFSAVGTQYPGLLVAGSNNTFTQTAGAADTIRYTLVGNSNTINTDSGSINAMNVGNNNNLQSLNGAMVVVGNLLNTTRTAPFSTNGALFGSLSNARGNLSDYRGGAFLMASSVDSFPQTSIITAASSVLTNRNATARNVISCSTATSSCNAEELTMIGCSHQVTVTATLARSMTIVGNRITIPSLEAGTNTAVFGNGIVCSASNALVTKAVETPVDLSVVGTGTRSRAVTMSSRHRLSSTEPTDNTGTIDTDADAVPATAQAFDSIFEQKNLFRPTAVAAAATLDVPLSSALGNSNGMNLEFAFQIVDTTAVTFNTYRGRSRAFRQGGATSVDAPIIDSFIGITATITVSLVVVANAPALRFANTGVGANPIRVSGSSTFSTIAL